MEKLHDMESKKITNNKYRPKLIHRWKILKSYYKFLSLTVPEHWFFSPVVLDVPVSEYATILGYVRYVGMIEKINTGAVYKLVNRFY